MLAIFVGGVGLGFGVTNWELGIGKRWEGEIMGGEDILMQHPKQSNAPKSTTPPTAIPMIAPIPKAGDFFSAVEEEAVSLGVASPVEVAATGAAVRELDPELEIVLAVGVEALAPVKEYGFVVLLATATLAVRQ